ncbi:stromal membrane-associated protein 1 isoform X3 [Oryzias latipes]|uniref:stromal membrane-associated protein 1 isoform X3 n=1 Tax=Oryzias latipes TaxID=8090 RepID=UPI0009DA77C6|nr:stromal membrane-associated protein 1 isoform X3 [Oryzias latipes]
MTTRSEREKAQKLNEEHQTILSKLLKEEDNKYCADCEAKGPRWASWNLGVFMCIRCAGIHRNLGVHISRVKSVNLDQWTPEQIQSMVDMGNTRAKHLYEAHLPENFRRPQTDQAVEVFIRDKYERKKYYNKEAAAAAPHSECRSNAGKITEPTVDLLDLDAPGGEGNGSEQTASTADELDVFGPMVSNPLSPSKAQQGQSSSSPAPQQVDSSSSSSASTSTKVMEKKLLSKDSILSLYASSSVGIQPQQSQQQPAEGPAGAYVGQPQMQFAPQCFGPSTTAGAPPTAMMSAMTLINGGYMGLQQQQGGPPANQGPNMYNLQQGQQWSMSMQASGVAVSSAGPPAATSNQSGTSTAGTTASLAPAAGQTLSNQLWK